MELLETIRIFAKYPQVPRALDVVISEYISWMPGSEWGVFLWMHHWKRLWSSCQHFNRQGNGFNLEPGQDEEAMRRNVWMEIVKSINNHPIGDYDLKTRLIVGYDWKVAVELTPFPSDICWFPFTEDIPPSIVTVTLDTQPTIPKNYSTKLCHKTTDRLVYNECRERNDVHDFSRDVIMFTEDSFITETTISNIAIKVVLGMDLTTKFGIGSWVTPDNGLLLPGTFREFWFRISEHYSHITPLSPAKITVKDLADAVKVGNNGSLLKSLILQV